MTTISDHIKAFSREVRRRRELLGLTLDELAERAKLTPNYIGTIENNHRDPSLSTLFALAKGLGTTLSELFGGGVGVSPIAIHAARLFEQLAPDLQKGLITFMMAALRKEKPPA